MGAGVGVKDWRLAGTDTVAAVLGKESTAGWSRSVIVGPHETLVLLKDGQIQGVFSEGKFTTRSFTDLIRGLGGGTPHTQAVMLDTSPSLLQFWLGTPDDEDSQGNAPLLAVTQDGEIVTAQVTMRVSISPDAPELLLRLLRGKQLLTNSDLERVVRHELSGRVLQLELAQHQALELRGNQQLLSTLVESAQIQLQDTLLNFGLRLDTFDMSWGLSEAERRGIEERRQFYAVQKTALEAQIRQASQSSVDHDVLALREPGLEASAQSGQGAAVEHAGTPSGSASQATAIQNLQSQPGDPRLVEWDRRGSFSTGGLPTVVGVCALIGLALFTWSPWSQTGAGEQPLASTADVRPADRQEADNNPATDTNNPTTDTATPTPTPQSASNSVVDSPASVTDVVPVDKPTGSIDFGNLPTPIPTLTPSPAFSFATVVAPLPLGATGPGRFEGAMPNGNLLFIAEQRVAEQENDPDRQRCAEEVVTQGDNFTPSIYKTACFASQLIMITREELSVSRTWLFDFIGRPLSYDNETIYFKSSKSVDGTHDLVIIDIVNNLATTTSVFTNVGFDGFTYDLQPSCKPFPLRATSDGFVIVAGNRPVHPDLDWKLVPARNEGDTQSYHLEYCENQSFPSSILEKLNSPGGTPTTVYPFMMKLSTGEVSPLPEGFVCQNCIPGRFLQVNETRFLRETVTNIPEQGRNTFFYRLETFDFDHIDEGWREIPAIEMGILLLPRKSPQFDPVSGADNNDIDSLKLCDFYSHAPNFFRLCDTLYRLDDDAHINPLIQSLSPVWDQRHSPNKTRIIVKPNELITYSVIGQRVTVFSPGSFEHAINFPEHLKTLNDSGCPTRYLADGFLITEAGCTGLIGETSGGSPAEFALVDLRYDSI